MTCLHHRLQLRLVETGGTNNHFLAMGGAECGIGCGHRGNAKVDKYIEVADNLLQRSHQRNIVAAYARKFTGVYTDQ